MGLILEELLQQNQHRFAYTERMHADVAAPILKYNAALKNANQKYTDGSPRLGHGRKVTAPAVRVRHLEEDSVGAIDR